MNNREKYESFCFGCAGVMIKNGLAHDMDIFALTDLLIDIEIEKEEKQLTSDGNIDFNDEIVSIDDMGEMETVDISVTGDQLFYCNNILTKNSMGTSHVADFIAAIIRTEELDQMNQIMFKQLKNRYDDMSKCPKFVVGVDRNKMKLFDVSPSAQATIINTSTSKSPSDKFRGIRV